MRIIGGSAKRRGFKSPAAGHGVRPILARIKKSLFDILQLRVPDSVFLDLYAGSGSVGVEALSRGAAAVTFADLNPSCLSIIKQNLSRLQLFERARVVKADATRNLSHVGGPFDLIFMGPPYHDAKWNALHLTSPTLSAIAASSILKPGGWVIGQHHAKEILVDDPRWKMFRQEDYGDSRLSFLNMLDSKVIVIKYGGSLLEDPSHRHAFLEKVAALARKTKMVLVHGGGKEITRALDQKGIQARFVNGLRVTDDATMDVVEEVLTRLNREIIQELEGFGIRVESYSGKSDRVVTAQPIPDLGRVGKPERVDLPVFGRLLARPPLPVFYSVAVDGSGRSLNINADDFAQALAIACRASRLIFLTDSGALLDKAGNPIPQINYLGVDRLLEDGTITGGMVIKVKACVEALKQGVGRVDICKNIDNLVSADEQRLEGTRIVKEDQPTVENP